MTLLAVVGHAVICFEPLDTRYRQWIGLRRQKNATMHTPSRYNMKCRINEMIACLEDVVNELMVDFPDDDARKIRYKKAIANFDWDRRTYNGKIGLRYDTKI